MGEIYAGNGNNGKWKVVVQLVGGKSLVKGQRSFDVKGR
jgi:hypothetical protein